MANRTIPITNQRIIDYFISKVDIFQPSNQCWEWRGNKMTTGYGVVSLGYYKGPNHYKEGAHRISYIAYNGEDIPKGMYVCHRCDNPGCVNPTHLFLGTNSDNQIDCIKKGRANFRSLKASKLNKELSSLRERDSKGRFLKYG